MDEPWKPPPSSPDFTGMNARSPKEGLRIGDHHIRQGGRPFIVAEVAQAHDGSLGFAHSFIDIAAGAGADAIKFQTHIAEAESTREEQFRVPFSYEDATRYDYWRRMEFSFEQWQGLARHAREKNLVFLSSCFSVTAVEWMRRLEMPAWKIGSGEIATPDLLDAVLEGGEPLLVSTGIAGHAAIDAIIGKADKRGTPVALFQCTSEYPAPLEHVGLNVIDDLHQRYGVPVGLSDHSGSVWPAVAAMARGAAMIEVHIAFHKGQFGPDTAASLTPEQLAQLVEARDAIDLMLGHPVDKEASAALASGTRRTFGKSLALKAPLPAGTVIGREHLAWKKPGGGLGEDDLGRVLGLRLRRDTPADRLLRLDDLE